MNRLSHIRADLLEQNGDENNPVTCYGCRVEKKAIVMTAAAIHFLICSFFLGKDVVVGETNTLNIFHVVYIVVCATALFGLLSKRRVLLFPFFAVMTCLTLLFCAMSLSHFSFILWVFVHTSSASTFAEAFGERMYLYWNYMPSEKKEYQTSEFTRAVSWSVFILVVKMVLAAFHFLFATASLHTMRTIGDRVVLPTRMDRDDVLHPMNGQCDAHKARNGHSMRAFPQPYHGVYPKI